MLLLLINLTLFKFIFLDLLFNSADTVLILFKQLINLKELLHALIVLLRLVYVTDLHIEGKGTNIKDILFLVLTVLSQLMKEIGFLAYQMMKFEMINHLSSYNTVTDT